MKAHITTVGIFYQYGTALSTWGFLNFRSTSSNTLLRFVRHLNWQALSITNCHDIRLDIFWDIAGLVVTDVSK